MMNVLRRSSNLNDKHLVILYFDAYQDGVLTEAKTAAYRQHLNTCPECQVWADDHTQITQQLKDEAPPPAFLSPAAAAHIQQNISSRLRRALIMNSLKTTLGAVTAVAVLTVIVGFFVWQSRNIDTEEVETAEQVTPQFEIIAGKEDEQLIEAVIAKDPIAIERLLEAGADPNAMDPSGDPALKSAVLRRTADIVELLVENGADVNALDSHGDALIAIAADMSGGNLEVMKILLDAGADVNGTMTDDPDPTSPGMNTTGLSLAAYDNRIGVVELLIAYGANVNQAEKLYNATPLHSAAYRNNAEIVRILIDNGADPNPVSTYITGATPLHYAIAGGSVEAIQALLDGGAEPDIYVDGGQTPLTMAIIEDMSPGRRSEILTLLLEAGADPNLQNGIGNTPLHQTAKWNRIDAIPILIEYGASLDIQNKKDQTALDVAVDDRIIELLQKAMTGE